MKRKLLLFAALGLQTLAHAVSRFPKPDFESGYQYPEVSYAIPHEHFWNVVDVVLLVVLLSVPLKTVLTVRLFDKYASLFLLAKIAMVILMHVC